MGRKLLVALLILGLILAVAVWQRYRILLPQVTPGEPIPQLTDASPVPGGQPFAAQPHFSVVQLDESTYAIAEPFSWARNVNYLILGEDRALLFDAGVGHYDIRPVVASLTDLPLTFMPSHFHYDHTGQGDWTRIAVVDLPHVRERASGDLLTPTWGEHLGSGEGIQLPSWAVTEWVKPNSAIDLGGRSLVLLYTPGHTDNSVSLFDVERQLMFTGDFLTDNGGLSSFLPTARPGDFLQSADKVLARTREMQRMVFRGAHAGIENTIPESDRRDLQTLRDGLVAIRDGELAGDGSYPVVYTLKDGGTMTMEPSWLQNWEPTYADGHSVH